MSSLDMFLKLALEKLLTPAVRGYIWKSSGRDPWCVCEGRMGPRSLPRSLQSLSPLLAPPKDTSSDSTACLSWEKPLWSLRFTLVTHVNSLLTGKLIFDTPVQRMVKNNSTEAANIPLSSPMKLHGCYWGRQAPSPCGACRESWWKW